MVLLYCAGTKALFSHYGTGQATVMVERFLSERSSTRALTLVELLVVIAVIGVLIALLLPAIQSARESGRRAACVNNQRQMGLAVQAFQMAKDVYPSSSNFDLDIHWLPLEQHSWASFILPYLEQTALYDSIDFDEDLRHEHNLRAAATVVSTYRCPSYAGPDYSESFSRHTDHQYAIGNYAAFSAVTAGHMWRNFLEPTGVIFPLSNVRPKDITDGLTHTILIVESREERRRVWMDGLYGGYTSMVCNDNGYYNYHYRVSLNDSRYYMGWSEYGPSSMHPGGGYHLFGDGSVRFVHDSILPTIYNSYATRDGDNWFHGRRLP